MGNWYTNISLKSMQQSDAIAALDELGRRAYVTPDADLAEALGIPSGSVGLGYEYENRSEAPPNISRETLRRTLSG